MSSQDIKDSLEIFDMVINTFAAIQYVVKVYNDKNVERISKNFARLIYEGCRVNG